MLSWLLAFSCYRVIHVVSELRSGKEQVTAVKREDHQLLPEQNFNVFHLLQPLFLIP
jgi:hypothetical protein